MWGNFILLPQKPVCLLPLRLEVMAIDHILLQKLEMQREPLHWWISGEEEAEGRPSRSLNYLTGGCSEGGLVSSPPATGQEAMASGCITGRFRLDIRKNFFPERVVRPCPRLPRAVVESPSLEGFSNHVDVALGDMVEQAWWCWVDGWT